MGKITWPSDVTHYKQRINPSFVATDQEVKRCTSLPAGERASWDGFYASWRAFYGNGTADSWLFGSGGEYDDVEAYETQLQGWRAQLRQDGCELSAGPELPPPSDSLPSSIKWAAAAVIVVGVVWGVRTIVK